MADQVRDLHAAIMSLPCNTLHAGSPDYQAQAAYGRGFKDARHKAAELAASHAADVEALRADAERYRWLRVKLGTSDMDAQDSAIYALNAANREPTTPESFDAAIDAARAALKGDKP